MLLDPTKTSQGLLSLAVGGSPHAGDIAAWRYRQFYRVKVKLTMIN